MTLCLVRPLLRLGFAGKASPVPILMYHSISDDPESGVGGYYRVCTSRASFRRQMHYLHEQSYRTIPLESPAELFPSQPGDRRVAITFDDGFRDNLTAALPVLEEFGFTATVYLPTAFIADQRREFKGRQCLTWGEVREMRDRGIRFGSHTVNHPVLYQLSWREIESELRDSRAGIEDRLQMRATAFAYPYAFPQQDRVFVDRFKDLLSRSGYDSAVTTVIGRARPGDDTLALKRLPVNSGDDFALFRAKLEGAYDWLAAVQSVAKRLKGTRSRTAAVNN